MQQPLNYIPVAVRTEDNVQQVTPSLTWQGAGEFVRTLDQHPTGGFIFLLIVAALMWYLVKKK